MMTMATTTTVTTTDGDDDEDDGDDDNVDGKGCYRPYSVGMAWKGHERDGADLKGGVTKE